MNWKRRAIGAIPAVVAWAGALWLLWIVLDVPWTRESLAGSHIPDRIGFPVALLCIALILDTMINRR